MTSPSARDGAAGSEVINIFDFIGLLIDTRGYISSLATNPLLIKTCIIILRDACYRGGRAVVATHPSSNYAGVLKAIAWMISDEELSKGFPSCSERLVEFVLLWFLAFSSPVAANENGERN